MDLQDAFTDVAFDYVTDPENDLIQEVPIKDWITGKDQLPLADERTKMESRELYLKDIQAVVENIKKTRPEFAEIGKYEMTNIKNRVLARFNDEYINRVAERAASLSIKEKTGVTPEIVAKVQEDKIKKFNAYREKLNSEISTDLTEVSTDLAAQQKSEQDAEYDQYKVSSEQLLQKAQEMIRTNELDEAKAKELYEAEDIKYYKEYERKFKLTQGKYVSLFLDAKRDSERHFLEQSKKKFVEMVGTTTMTKELAKIYGESYSKNYAALKDIQTQALEDQYRSLPVSEQVHLAYEAGKADLYVGVGGVLGKAGFEDANYTITAVTDQLHQEDFKVPVINPDGMFDSAWWIANGVRTLPMMVGAYITGYPAGVLVGGVAGAGGAALLRAKKGLDVINVKRGINIIKAMGAGTASWKYETLLEQGHSFNDAISAGYTVEQASEEAAMVGARNLAALPLFMLEMAPFFNKMGPGIAVLTSAVSNGSQELVQGYAQSSSRDVTKIMAGEKEPGTMMTFPEYLQTPQAAQAGVLGFGIGGIFGLAGNVMMTHGDATYKKNHAILSNMVNEAGPAKTSGMIQIAHQNDMIDDEMYEELNAQLDYTTSAIVEAENIADTDHRNAITSHIAEINRLKAQIDPSKGEEDMLNSALEDSITEQKNKIKGILSGKEPTYLVYKKGSDLPFVTSKEQLNSLLGNETFVEGIKDGSTRVSVYNDPELHKRIIEAEKDNKKPPEDPPQTAQVKQLRPLEELEAELVAAKERQKRGSKDEGLPAWIASLEEGIATLKKGQPEKTTQQNFVPEELQAEKTPNNKPLYPETRTETTNQKDDIEKRRQEELDKTSAVDHYNNQLTKDISLGQRSQAEKYLKDPVAFSENAIAIAKKNLESNSSESLNRINENVIQTAERRLKEIAEINAKYDAEIEALETTPKESKPAPKKEAETKPAPKKEAEDNKTEGKNKNGSIYKSTTKEKDGLIITKYESYRKEDGKKYTLDGRRLTKEEFLSEYEVDEDTLKLLEGVEEIVIREVRNDKGKLGISVKLKLSDSSGWENAEIAALETKPAPKKEAAPKKDKTDKEFDTVSKGMKADGIRSMYKINREIFGLNKVQSLADAIITDMVFGEMAEREGISKKEMYGRVEYRKADQAPDGSLKQESEIWKSTATEGLSKITQKAATPEQWVKMIADKGGKGTTQELEWIGLAEQYKEWIEFDRLQDARKKLKESGKSLTEIDKKITEIKKSLPKNRYFATDIFNQLVDNVKKGTVPKEVVEQYIADNKIEIKEVPKSKNKPARWEKSNDRWDYGGYNIRLENGEDYVIYRGDRVIESKGDLDFAKEAVLDYVLEDAANSNGNVGDAKHASLVLEGGENYREVLLILSGQGRKPMSKNFKETNHYDEANILAHVRINERTLSNGERVMFVEEVQSDWAQKGKKKGFGLQTRKAIIYDIALGVYSSYRKSDTEGATDVFTLDGVEYTYGLNQNKKHYSIYKADENGNATEYVETTATIDDVREFAGDKTIKEVELGKAKKALLARMKGEAKKEGITDQEIEDALKEYGDFTQSRPSTLGVPDMPYKKTDQWVGMAMRRVMKMAADGGFDRVAWTTGEQQQDRYDLSKQVKSVRLVNMKAKYPNVSEGKPYAIIAYDKEGYAVIDKRINKDEVESYVGKEVAKKLTEDNSKVDEFENMIEGDDLKVGGKGMEEFYNSILPKVVQKEAKRFDKNAKVEVVDFAGKGESKSMQKEYNDWLKENNLPQESADDLLYGPNKEKLTIQQKQYLKDFIENWEESGGVRPSGKTKKQLSIPITPEMRMNLNKAVPLFQSNQGAMAVGDKKYIIYALTNPNVSTPVHELAHVYEHSLNDKERGDILKWAGHKEWTTKTSEKFARGFEKYLATGKAPTSKLQAIFDRFKAWLTDIYNGITGSSIDIELNDKMADIYAQMLGVEKAKPKTDTVSKITEEAKGDEAKYPRKDYKNNPLFKKIVDRFKKSPNKKYGNKVKRKLPSGETVTGRYVLINKNDVAASHDPKRGWAKTEGVPVNENGKTFNDNDYENVKTAQNKTEGDSKNYDRRAIDNIIYIDGNGIIKSGNGRVIARKMATTEGAKEYLSDLKSEIENYGLTEEDIAAIGDENVMLGVELDGTPVYSTKEYAKYNADDTKQKTPLQEAKVASKIMTDAQFSKLAGIIGQVEQMSKLDQTQKNNIKSTLIEIGLINQNNQTRYFNEENNITEAGKEFLENTMLAGVFNETILDLLNNDGLKSIRNALAWNKIRLTKNSALPAPFNILDNIKRAIVLINSSGVKKASFVTDMKSYVSKGDLLDAKDITPDDIYWAVILQNRNTINKAVSDFNVTGAGAATMDAFAEELGAATTEEKFNQQQKNIQDGFTKDQQELIEYAKESNKFHSNQSNVPETSSTKQADTKEAPAEEVNPETVAEQVSDKTVEALEGLKINTKGKAFDATIGIPIAVWNASVDAVILAYKGGKLLADAIQAGIDYVKSNHQETFNEEEYQSKISKKLEKILQQEMIEAMDEKLSVFETAVFGTPSLTDETISKDTVLQSPWRSKAASILAKTLGIPGSMLNFAMEKTLTKIRLKMGDAFDKIVQKGLVSNLKYVRGVSRILEDTLRLGITRDRIYKSDEMIGRIYRAVSDATHIRENMHKIINGDPKKMERVHRALDPKLYETMTLDEFITQFQNNAPQEDFDSFSEEELDGLYQQYLDSQDPITSQPIDFSELEPDEQQLFNLIRTVNDFTHDLNFALGRINLKTYDKHKGKYLARAYEIYEFPEAINERLKGPKAIEQIYKKRKDDISEWMQENFLKDPIYLTANRLYQTLNNEAIYGYAEWISKNKTDMVSKTERDGFHFMGKGYGALSNKWVEPGVKQDFDGFFYTTKVFDKMYDFFKSYDALGARKFYRNMYTVYNPGVQLGNITGNVFFSFFQGIDPVSLHNAMGDAISELRGNGPLWRYLLKKGLLKSQLTKSEVLSNLDTFEAHIAEKSLGQKVKTLPDRIYNSVDDLYKVAAYIVLVKQGTKPDQALRSVQNGFQNFKRIPKIYDVASKTPVIGNMFARWPADLARMTGQLTLEKPAFGMAFLYGMATLAVMASKMFDEPEKAKKFRENRTGTPLIPISEDNYVPLSWKISKLSELNAARLMSPMYVYRDADFDPQWEFLWKFSPYQFTPVNADKAMNYNGVTATWIGKNIQDPLFEWVRILPFVDSDFRGMPVLEPDRNPREPSTLTVSERYINAGRYAIRNGLPTYGAFIMDMYSAFRDEEDYYKRKRNVGQVVASFMGFKVQQIDADKMDRIYKGALRSRVYEFMSNSRKVSKILKDYEDGDISEETAMKRLIVPLENEGLLLKDIKKIKDDILTEVGQDAINELIKDIQGAKSAVNKADTRQKVDFLGKVKTDLETKY